MAGPLAAATRPSPLAFQPIHRTTLASVAISAKAIIAMAGPRAFDRRRIERRMPPGRALPAGTGRPQRRASPRRRYTEQTVAGVFEYCRRAAPSVLDKLLPVQREEGRHIPARQSPR